MLRVSLEDGQLNRTERDEFRQWIEESAPDGPKRALYQSMAFDLAHGTLGRNDLPPHSVLNWLERIGKLLTPLASTGPTLDIAEAVFSPQHDGAARIVGLFDTARVSVEVCVFTITDDRISQAMISAHRRGVRLRVITDDDKRVDPGSDVEWLVRSGIPVRVDRTEYHMHHKFAIFDGRMLLNGSYNWTRSASLHNEENFLLTSESRLVQPFRELFEQLWTQFGGR